MRTLFEISTDLLALEEVLTDTEGEITDDAAGQALLEWFDQLTSDRDIKIDNYCLLMAELEARADVRAAEAARLSRLVAIDRNAADRLKRALKAFLERHGLTKLDTPLHKLTIAKNGGKAPLIIPDSWRDDAVNAPEAYHRAIIKLDTEAIRVDLEAGQEIAGCAIGERGTNLRIR